MKISEFICLILAIAFSKSISAQPIMDVQRSHIEANVPSEDFDSLLQRDLLNYFQASGLRAVTSTNYKLLRTAPTQSGVSYPKYYLWVRVYSGSSKVKEGAARVEAIQKSHFKVTDFLSISEIQSSSKHVQSVFPAALVPAIISMAGIR